MHPDNAQQHGADAAEQKGQDEMGDEFVPWGAEIWDEGVGIRHSKGNQHRVPLVLAAIQSDLLNISDAAIRLANP